MESFSARDVVHAWEAGRDRHPIDRALLLLSLTQPGTAAGELAALTVGERNRRLLALRRDLLGGTLNGYAECPACGQALEFKVDTEAIMWPEPAGRNFSASLDGFDLHVRLPDSHDLSAVAGMDEARAARTLLIDRCVLAAGHDGAEIDAGDLPDSLLPALADAMIEHDPQAEMRFRLACQACEHSWSALLDIVSFLWAEIDVYAKRLLHETHTLARAYGWNEAQILGLSTSRRKFYLDLVAG
jgi:hypothetical protein